MQPWELALEELSQYESIYPESYLVIDPYIKPLCEILTNNGFITMHSCSGHVQTRNFNLRRQFENGKWKMKKGKFGTTSFSNRWYVLFVPKCPVDEIRNLVEEINKKYSYEITLENVNDVGNLTNRWVIDEDMKFNFNDQQLCERHKNIYHEFKNHFESNSQEVNLIV